MDNIFEMLFFPFGAIQAAIIIMSAFHAYGVESLCTWPVATRATYNYDLTIDRG